MDRSKMIDTVKRKIDDFDREITRAEANLNEAGTQMRAEHADTVAEMKALRAKAEAQYHKLRADSKDGWARAQAAWDDIANGFDAARKRFV